MKSIKIKIILFFNHSILDTYTAAQEMLQHCLYLRLDSRILLYQLLYTELLIHAQKYLENYIYFGQRCGTIFMS